METDRGRTIVLTLTDLPDERAFCERLSALVRERGATLALCDAGGLCDVDVATVGALARAQLAAGRLGCELRLHGASRELLDLLALAGLDDVLRRCPLCVEPRRKAEEREEPLGGEEERELHDPAP